MNNDIVVADQSGNITAFKDLFLTMNDWGVTPIVFFFILIYLIKSHFDNKRFDLYNAKIVELLKESTKAQNDLTSAIDKQTTFFKNYLQTQDIHHNEIVKRLEEIKTNQILIITDKICKNFNKGESK